ncbi:MAG TPA: nucleoside 2-deoxyribosyltransferase [Ignavibacteriaceae bacterium]|nr:nucleoside 2-deoxyribosyltransferase [Ignavibacteriaceae bacterium]
MIVYCAGAIKGDSSFKDNYREIIDIVKKNNHSALSELNPDFQSAFPLNEHQIFQRDIKWIEKSNMMIAEVSGPSIGVGFEIAYALYVREIPVLALYNLEVEKVSSMVIGCNSTLLYTKKYNNSGELNDIIKRFLNQS